MLGPQAASALTFTFSLTPLFSSRPSVSGLISGLGEDSNPCNNTQPSYTVRVLFNDTDPRTTGVYRVDETAASDGFEVSPQGVITSADFLLSRCQMYRLRHILCLPKIDFPLSLSTVWQMRHWWDVWMIKELAFL
jgi:hypothetical protein